MRKLKVSSREIGTVRIFDVEGNATQESLQEVAWKIQRNIRRFRVQRMILNLQHLPSLDSLGVRKLLAACLRPQQSLIYGASHDIKSLLENTYLPRNVHICDTEVQITEDLGPFLLDKECARVFNCPTAPESGQLPAGVQLDRRRSKRMHVALPLRLCLVMPGSESIHSEAIASNISEGGLFAEFIDLDTAARIEELPKAEGILTEMLIHPSANFPEEYRLKGVIRHRDLRRGQLGLGIEFVDA